MSHYSLLAIGYKNEKELADAMAPYSEQLNIDPKWDYYSVEEKSTIGDVKRMLKEDKENFDPSPHEMVWDKIVNDIEPSTYNAAIFVFLWGKPDRENLIRMYGTKEKYVEHQRNSGRCSYAVLTDWGWKEPDMVGVVSAFWDAEKEFSETYFSKFILPYEDDTPVYMLDCHI